jgi:hypothetical protein
MSFSNLAEKNFTINHHSRYIESLILDVGPTRAFNCELRNRDALR